MTSYVKLLQFIHFSRIIANLVYILMHWGRFFGFSNIIHTRKHFLMKSFTHRSSDVHFESMSELFMKMSNENLKSKTMPSHHIMLSICFGILRSIYDFCYFLLSTGKLWVKVVAIKLSTICSNRYNKVDEYDQWRQLLQYTKMKKKTAIYLNWMYWCTIFWYFCKGKWFSKKCFGVNEWKMKKKKLKSVHWEKIVGQEKFNYA